MTTDMIIEFIFAVLGAVVTCFLIPYLKEKIKDEKMSQLLSFVEWAVRWAEQMYKEDQNLIKKQEVVSLVSNYLTRINLKLSEEEIDTIIEGVVNLVKKSLNDVKS